MSEGNYNVIKDIRTGKVYIDESLFLRNFEEVVGSFDTVTEAVEQFPDAIIVQ